MAAAVELDIVIPVYNEGENIISVLEALRREVKTPFRVLICYDREEDTALAALAKHPMPEVPIELVRNRGAGAFGAIMTGFEQSTAPAVIMLAADDDYNAHQIDGMVRKSRAEGCEVVVASRFVKGGCMKGCRFTKASIVRVSAWALYHVGRLPVRDASNGFRLFSRRVLDSIPIESTAGFTYSIELLVKAHRLRWKIGEVPVSWYERKHGASRFKILKWLPQYFKWFRYAFATTYLFRGAGTVRLKSGGEAQRRRSQAPQMV